MSDTFPAGTRALQVPVVLRGVEAHCDEAQFPSRLALTLGAADLHLPPIVVSAVRVSGPVNWRSGLLGVDLYTQFIFFFSISATAPFDHDGLLRALARAIHTSFTLRLAPSSGFFGGSLVALPRDGWTLYQRLLGRPGWYDVYHQARVLVGPPAVPITRVDPSLSNPPATNTTKTPAAPNSPAAPTSPATPSLVVVVPEVTIGGGRAEWQLSRAEVTRYQTVLYNLGELARPQDADGLIGPTTRVAVREFQHVYNRRQNDPAAASRLWSPRSLREDGILGPETQRALDNFRGYRRDDSYDGWAAL